MLNLTIREARTSYEGTRGERKSLYRILRVEDKSGKWRALQLLRRLAWFRSIEDGVKRKRKIEEIQRKTSYIRFYDKKTRTFASGLVEYVKKHYKGKIKIHDLRKPLPKFDLTFKKFDFQDEVEVREEQLSAVRQALFNGRGILHCATNAGKTAMSSAIVAEYQKQQKRSPRVLYLVHRISLVNQAAKEFKRHLDIPITQLGAGKKKPPSRGILVATVQTATNVLHTWKFKRFLEKCDILFFDELHVNRAAMATRTSKFCKAPMRFGLSGTIDEKSKVKMMHYIGLTGPVLAEIRNKELVEKGRSAKPYIRFIEVPCEEYSTYAESYREAIVRNSRRNRTAVKEVLRYLEKGLKVLVTVVRIKHGLKLLHKLEQATDLKSEFLSGRTPLPVRERMINDFKLGRVPILVVSDVFSVGMDVPEIDSWVNCAGGKSWEQALQRLGRTLRAKKSNRNRVYVSDFIDLGNHWLFKHSVKRLQYYEREDMADIKIIRRNSDNKKRSD